MLVLKGDSYSCCYDCPSVCLFRNFVQTIFQQPLAGIYCNFIGSFTIKWSCAYLVTCSSSVKFSPSSNTNSFALVCYIREHPSFLVLFLLSMLEVINVWLTWTFLFLNFRNWKSPHVKGNASKMSPIHLLLLHQGSEIRNSIKKLQQQKEVNVKVSWVRLIKY